METKVKNKIDEIIDEMAEELKENINLDDYFISFEEYLGKLEKAVEKVCGVILTEQDLLKVDDLIFNKTITIVSSNSTIRVFTKNNRIYYIQF